MKKNLTKKLFGLTFAMALTLTACGSGDTTDTLPSSVPASASSKDDIPASAGALLLSVNPEIEMHYDEEGDVVALTGLNDDGRAVLASYKGYKGSPCKTVVGDLVNKINAAGYFDATIDGRERNIVLKLARGSQYPSDGFLNELATAVQDVVDADQIGSRTVALDDDDYDDAHGDKGYINATAAQSILATQLGREDLEFVEKDYDLDDGAYEVEFVLDGVKYEYEVNALTGKVNEVDVDRQGYGVTDYNDTDYGPNNDGVTDYNDTDYGPNNDGVTDYNDTDYGPNNDGITDYNDTDYGPNNDGVTNYNDTNYGSNNNGGTNYNDTNYGSNNNGGTNYNDSNYSTNNGGSDYDDGN